MPIFDGLDVNIQSIKMGEEDARIMLTNYLNNGDHHNYFDETDSEFYHGDYDHDQQIPQVQSSQKTQKILKGFDLIRKIIAERG